jgi:hypothetical protein
VPLSALVERKHTVRSLSVSHQSQFPAITLTTLFPSRTSVARELARLSKSVTSVTRPILTRTF